MADLIIHEETTVLNVAADLQSTLASICHAYDVWVHPRPSNPSWRCHQSPTIEYLTSQSNFSPQSLFNQRQINANQPTNTIMMKIKPWERRTPITTAKDTTAIKPYTYPGMTPASRGTSNLEGLEILNDSGSVQTLTGRPRHATFHHLFIRSDRRVRSVPTGGRAGDFWVKLPPTSW